MCAQTARGGDRHNAKAAKSGRVLNVQERKKMRRSITALEGKPIVKPGQMGGDKSATYLGKNSSTDI